MVAPECKCLCREYYELHVGPVVAVIPHSNAIRSDVHNKFFWQSSSLSSELGLGTYSLRKTL